MKVGAWQAMTLVIRRELCLSFRRPEQLLQPLVFFLIVTTLFPLGLNLQLSLLRDMSPGVLWVAALLSSLLSLDSLFKSDADDGTLEQLALSGQGLTLIVVAKTGAHWLVTGLALVIVSPIVGTALGIPASAFAIMMLSLALGTLTLSWLGSDNRSAPRQCAAFIDRPASGDAAADFWRCGHRPGDIRDEHRGSHVF